MPPANGRGEKKRAKLEKMRRGRYSYRAFHHLGGIDQKEGLRGIVSFNNIGDPVAEDEFFVLCAIQGVGGANKEVRQ